MTGDDTFPVVLLHGLGGCSFQWSGVVDRLDGPVVAPDAPYHGGRPATGALTFVAAAADALAVADSRGFDRFSVAGISMGAATALTLASLHPDRVHGVLAVAPAWFDQVDPPNLDRLAKLGRLIAVHGLSFGWELVGALPPVSGWASSDREAYRQRFLAYDPDAVARALVDLPGQLPVLDTTVLARRPGPSLVVGWQDDPIHPVVVAEQVACALGAPSPTSLPRPTDFSTEQDLLATLVQQMRSPSIRQAVAGVAAR
jgi:pimeloyl-ACP methyl ester carboxylesterase